jgi:hypothetical protein
MEFTFKKESFLVIAENGDGSVLAETSPRQFHLKWWKGKCRVVGEVRRQKLGTFTLGPKGPKRVKGKPFMIISRHSPRS